MFNTLFTRVICCRFFGKIHITEVGERHYVDGLVVLKLGATGFRAFCVAMIAFRVESEVKVGVRLRLRRMKSEREV